ncbi:MAG: hypothetical protein VYE73_07875 [Acidobacteriota bacterium]|nr:hypothetical protein [Acidobacteriota bacterium]
MRTLLLLVLAGVSAAAHAQTTLSYRFSEGPAPNTLWIELRLGPRPGDDPIRLYHLPETFGPAQTLHQFVEVASITNARATPATEPGQTLLTAKAGSEPIVRYLLRQAWPGPPTDRMRVFWPHLQKRYWYFTATTALLVPDLTGTTAVEMVWEPPASSTGWKVVSGRGHDLDCGAVCRISFSIDSHADLRGDPDRALFFVAGELDVVHRRIRAAGRYSDLFVSIHGRPDYAADGPATLSAIETLVTTQQEFWGDPVHDRFLVNMIVFPNLDANNFGGFNGARAFSSLVPKSAVPAPPGSILPRVGWDRLLGHVAHEYAHTWLRPDMLDLGDRDPALAMWLTEGVTEFVSRALLERAGLRDRAGAIEAVNEDLRRYHELFRAARNASASDAIDGFWNDYALQRQPYLRGSLMALNWNARMVEEGSGTLLDLARELIKSAAKRPFTEAELYRRAASRVPGGIQGDVERYWVRGQTIPTAASAFGPCYRLVERAGTPQFEPSC